MIISDHTVESSQLYTKLATLPILHVITLSNTNQTI